MNIEQYVQKYIDSSVKDGVTHIAKEFNNRYNSLSDVTIEDMESWLKEVTNKKNSLEKFSIDHCYYWSFESHLEGLIFHAKRLQNEASCV